MLLSHLVHLLSIVTHLPTRIPHIQRLGITNATCTIYSLTGCAAAH